LLSSILRRRLCLPLPEIRSKALNLLFDGNRDSLRQSANPEITMIVLWKLKRNVFLADGLVGYQFLDASLVGFS
jgi:hypothetical protein